MMQTMGRNKFKILLYFLNYLTNAARYVLALLLIGRALSPPFIVIPGKDI